MWLSSMLPYQITTQWLKIMHLLFYNIEAQKSGTCGFHWIKIKVLGGLCAFGGSGMTPSTTLSGYWPSFVPCSYRTEVTIFCPLYMKAVLSF